MTDLEFKEQNKRVDRIKYLEGCLFDQLLEVKNLESTIINSINNRSCVVDKRTVDRLRAWTKNILDEERVRLRTEYSLSKAEV